MLLTLLFLFAVLFLEFEFSLVDDSSDESILENKLTTFVDVRQTMFRFKRILLHVFDQKVSLALSFLLQIFFLKIAKQEQKPNVVHTSNNFGNQPIFLPLFSHAITLFIHSS